MKAAAKVLQKKEKKTAKTRQGKAEQGIEHK